MESCNVNGRLWVALCEVNINLKQKMFKCYRLMEIKEKLLA